MPVTFRDFENEQTLLTAVSVCSDVPYNLCHRQPKAGLSVLAPLEAVWRKNPSSADCVKDGESLSDQWPICYLELNQEPSCLSLSKY